MNRTSTGKLLLSIALATVLAVGAIFVWMIGIGWVLSVANQLLSPQKPYENLTFTEDGKPLVQTTTYSPNNTTVYRTLDGRDVENLDRYDLQNAHSMLPGGDLQAFDQPGWSSRIIGFAEPSGMPYFWYLINDGRADGHGYFMGFDAKTKLPIGFLGSAGFRADRPPLDERFKIDHSLSSYWGLFAGQQGNSGQEPNGYWKGSPPAIFLASSGSLFRVDLRHRSVASVPIDGKVVSVGNIGQPVRVPEEPRAIEKIRIGVRLADRVAVLDDMGGVLRTVPIPSDVRGRMLTVYLTTGPESIVVGMQDMRHDVTEIYWLNADGSVARHEQSRLRGGYFNGGEEPGWRTAAGLPSPLLCAILFAVTRPRESVSQGRFADYQEALAASLAESWPAFLAVVALSAVLAVATFRRHLRYRQPFAIAWALFVLLSGPAGLVGYLLYRQWPATGRCPQCGADAPRDREQCAACAAEFPTPALKGIEVFA